MTNPSRRGSRDVLAGLPVAAARAACPARSSSNDEAEIGYRPFARTYSKTPRLYRSDCTVAAAPVSISGATDSGVPASEDGSVVCSCS